MGLLNNYLPNCQRAKLNLRIKKAGRLRITLGRKARIMGRKINSGATCLNNIIFNYREILNTHFISPFDTFKGDIFIPFFPRGENSINQTSKFSCKCTSSSFFRFTSSSQPIVEVSHLGIISSCRGSSQDKSHFEPFVTFPCHFEEDFVFSGLINYRVKPDVSNEMFCSREPINGTTDFANDSSNSYFANSWDRKEDMIRVIGIHNSGNLMFNTFNLFLEGDNSFCSPFNFVSEERNGFFILKERKEREKFSKRRRNRRVFNIFRKRISGDKRKEASCEFFSNNFLVSWVNKPQIFPESIDIPCSFLNESSSKTSKGAEGKLLWGEIGRRRFWECYKEFCNHERVNFVSFREFKVRLSEFFNAVRIDDADGKSFTFPSTKEFLQIPMPVSGGFKAKDNRGPFPKESGESKGVLPEEFESVRKIRISMNRRDSFSSLVHKADIQRSRRNINTNKKSFGTHKTTSFPKDFSGYLTFPFSPDGYYPPGLRARSTSCNQISPPGVGKPSSFSCSWHIKNEGLPARHSGAGGPDTLTVLNFKYIGDKGKLKLLTM